MEEKFVMVSLGAWCRPAHNIRVYCENNSFAGTGSYPFDWTITSFHALQNILNPDFDGRGMLRTDDVVVSFARSGACNGTGLIFHHAIPVDAISKSGCTEPGQMVPVTGDIAEVVDNARGRFIHTLERLNALKNEDRHIVFVRWRRQGHPDRQFPGAFEDETDAALEALLEGYLGQGNFSILAVESKIREGIHDPISDPVIEFSHANSTYSAVIAERKGWNGDQSNSFRGDELSWTAAFDALFHHIQDNH